MRVYSACRTEEKKACPQAVVSSQVGVLGTKHRHRGFEYWLLFSLIEAGLQNSSLTPDKLNAALYNSS